MARSFGDVSYSKFFRSSQPSRAGEGVISFNGRLKPGWYPGHAAATAEGASAALTSTIARCESVSGGVRTTVLPSFRSDQPGGAVKVAPPGVERFASDAICSVDWGWKAARGITAAAPTNAAHVRTLRPIRAAIANTSARVSR